MEFVLTRLLKTHNFFNVFTIFYCFFNVFLYPKFENWKQHSYLAWQFQRQNKQVISEFFQKVENDCKAFGCTTAIISGEDFENCLVDHAMAIETEKMAKLAGFKEIEDFGLLKQVSVDVQR